MPGVITVGYVSFNEAPHYVQGCTLTPVPGWVSVGGSHYGSLEETGGGRPGRSQDLRARPHGPERRLATHLPPACLPALWSKALAKSCPSMCLRALPSVHSSPHRSPTCNLAKVTGHLPCQRPRPVAPTCVCPAPVSPLSFLLHVYNAYSWSLLGCLVSFLNLPCLSCSLVFAPHTHSSTSPAPGHQDKPTHQLDQTQATTSF